MVVVDVIKKFYTIEEEKNGINEFINKNGYPEFNKVLLLTQKMNKQYKDFFCKIQYTQFTHVACKKLYENITDKELVKKIGVDLNNHGGMVYMQYVFYIVRDCTPFSESKNIVISTCPHLIEFFWKGVGKWLP